MFGLCKWLVHEVLMNVSLCCNPHFKAFAHLLFLVHRAREHAPSSSSYYLFLLSFGSLSFKSCEKLLSFDYVCNCDQTCLKNKQTNKKVWMMNVQGLVHKMPKLFFFSWCGWWKCGFGCDATMVTFVIESPSRRKRYVVHGVFFF